MSIETTEEGNTAPDRLPVRGLADWAAMIIASGFGLGFAPIAPGTFGSLLGVGIFYFLSLKPALVFQPQLFQNCILAAAVLTAFAGTWAASRSERIFGRKDAGQIVMDEVCGQLITFAFVPVHLSKQLPLVMLAGFLLFRFFDIVKPYPIRRMEGLGGGLGVMADDILAGLYAALVLSFFLPFATQLLR
ncbi:MAG: phosphatidylglycerophosphatase A [Blastocatellia bacterium]